MMKPLIPGICCFLFSLAAFCQDSTITLSTFEQRSSQANKLIKTERKEISWAGGIAVAKMKTTDLESDSSVYAINLDNRNDKSLAIGDPSTLYIDMADIDPLVDALTFFLKEVNGLRSSTGVRYSYITTRDVMVSCEYIPWSETWRFYLGKVYKVLRSPVANSAVALNKKRLPELINLLKQAKALEW